MVQTAFAEATAVKGCAGDKNIKKAEGYLFDN